MNKEEIKIM